MTTLAQLASKKAELDALMKEHGKTAVSNELAAFFAKYPDLSIRWTQYTPYFNDGEPCHFSVHGVFVFKKDEEPDDDNDEVELGYMSYWLKDNQGKEWITQAISDDGKVLVDLLNGNRDALEAAFGDHMEVIASASGIEVNDYDHD